MPYKKLPAHGKLKFFLQELSENFFPKYFQFMVG